MQTREMKREYEVAVLDPAGNVTAIVLSDVQAAERARIAAQLLRLPRIVVPRRMLRAYPKLRHGSKLLSLSALREMLHRAEQENKDDNKKPK